MQNKIIIYINNSKFYAAVIFNIKFLLRKLKIKIKRIAKIIKKIRNTNITIKYIYGYNSHKIKSIIGLNIVFISFFMSSLFNMSKHWETKDSFIYI